MSLATGYNAAARGRAGVSLMLSLLPGLTTIPTLLLSVDTRTG